MVSSWLNPLLLDSMALLSTGLVCWPLPPPALFFPQSWLHQARLCYLTPAPCCLILVYHPSSSYTHGSSCLRTSFRPSVLCTFPLVLATSSWLCFLLSCICMASFIVSQQHLQVPWLLVCLLPSLCAAQLWVNPAVHLFPLCPTLLMPLEWRKHCSCHQLDLERCSVGL